MYWVNVLEDQNTIAWSQYATEEDIKNIESRGWIVEIVYFG